MISKIEITVRYSEVDKMGIVYYSRYLEYFEIGRSNWLSQFMIDYETIEENFNIGLPVIECGIKYIKPAKYNDKIFLQTKVDFSKLPTCITFNYLIELENEVLVEGITKHVVYNFFTKRVVRLPDVLLKKIDL